MATFVFEADSGGNRVTAGNFVDLPARSSGAAVRVEITTSTETQAVQMALQRALEAFKLRCSGDVPARDAHLLTEAVPAPAPRPSRLPK